MSREQPFKRWRVRTLVTEESVPILNINSKFTIDIRCSHLKDFARRSSDYPAKPYSSASCA